MINVVLTFFVMLALTIGVKSLAVHRIDDSSLANVASWRASGSAASARLIFSAPSSMDPAATVEVKERANGWRTVGLVGGTTKSIYHGIYKVDEKGDLDATVLVSSHLQTMAAIAIAASIEVNETQEEGAFLYLGLGAGSLSAFMQHYFQDSHHVAVELDEAVVSATESIQLQDSIDIEIGNALDYQRTPSQKPFDCIFVDIFDGANLLPCEFYSEQFIAKLRDEVLKPSGILVQNFHTGNKKLAAQLADAKAVFARSFETCYEVDSLDSKPNAGNTILVGSSKMLDSCRNSQAIGKVLTSAATDAQTRLGLSIDAVSILADARLLVSDTPLRQ